MQNRILKMDRHTFDNELLYLDTYGKSIIICNFFTYMVLCDNFNLKENDYINLNFLDYKGHEVYIHPNFKNLEYLIMPKQVSLKRLPKFKNLYKKKVAYNAE